MKINNLIEILNKIKDEYGDLDINLLCDDEEEYICRLEESHIIVDKYLCAVYDNDGYVWDKDGNKIEHILTIDPFRD